MFSPVVLRQPLPATRTITPLVGRMSGTFEWLCPLCHGMSRSWVDPRMPHVQCCMPGCRRTFAVGLVGHEAQPPVLPPFNGVLHDVHRTYTPAPSHGHRPLVTHYYNRRAVDVEPDAKPHLARIAGTVEWACTDPSCGTFNLAYPDWVTGLVACTACGHRLWIAAGLLWGRRGLQQHPADCHGLHDRHDRVRKYNLRATRSIRGKQRRLQRAVGAPKAGAWVTTTGAQPATAPPPAPPPVETDHVQ